MLELALLETLSAMGITPNHVLGVSFGEYAASGSLDPIDCMRLLTRQAAALRTSPPGGMPAVLAEWEVLDRVPALRACEIAARNHPGNFVVSAGKRRRPVRRRHSSPPMCPTFIPGRVRLPLPPDRRRAGRVPGRLRHSAARAGAFIRLYRAVRRWARGAHRSARGGGLHRHAGAGSPVPHDDRGHGLPAGPAAGGRRDATGSAQRRLRSLLAAGGWVELAFPAHWVFN